MAQYLMILMTMFLLSSTVWARVDVAQTQRMNLPETQEAVIIPKEFTEKVQPKSYNPDEGGGAVLSKMADGALSYWWDTTPLRKTKLGQAAEAVEQKARLQAKIEGSGMGSNRVTHTFDLKVLVMQALAKFEYKGWVRAGINYDARAERTEAEIRQEIVENKDLVVSQQFTSGESTSRVSFQFDW